MNTGGTGAFAPPQMGPPLYIYGAVFADKDVTQIVRSLITPQQTLSLKGETLAQQLGDGQLGGCFMLLLGFGVGFLDTYSLWGWLIPSPQPVAGQSSFAAQLPACEVLLTILVGPMIRRETQQLLHTC